MMEKEVIRKVKIIVLTKLIYRDDKETRKKENNKEKKKIATP